MTPAPLPCCYHQYHFPPAMVAEKNPLVTGRAIVERISDVAKTMNGNIGGLMFVACSRGRGKQAVARVFRRHEDREWSRSIK